MDNRKNNGGARESAGRKPKSDEIKLIESMDAITVPEKVWQALFNRVKDGDVQAIKTWLSYRFGMPKQMIEQKNINLTESDLTPDEVKRIKDSLLNAY